MATMTKNIAKSIVAKLRDINFLIDHINEGGCGAFAALLAEQLQKLGYEPKIVALAGIGWNCDPVGDLKKFSKNAERMHNSRIKNSDPLKEGVKINDHYCVMADGFYLDSKGYSILHDESGTVELLDETFVVIGEVPIEDMDYIAFFPSRCGWNRSYDRRQNPTMKKFIEKNLDTL